MCCYVIFAQWALPGPLEPLQNAGGVKGVSTRQRDGIFPFCVVSQTYRTPEQQVMYLCTQASRTGYHDVLLGS